MEPRISSLLVDPRMLDRNLFDQFSISATVSSRPLPVEPSHVGDELQIHQGKTLVGGSRSSFTHGSGPRGSNLALGTLQPLRPRPALTHTSTEENAREIFEGNSTKTIAKSSIPLAGVLNSALEPETPVAFSGSLQDLLLDTPRKRRRLDGSLDRSDQIVGANNVSSGSGPSNPLTLPKPLPSKKEPRRQRIPPLLQGLHQPPPDAGLFPRITDRPEELEKVASTAVNEKDRPAKDPRLINVGPAEPSQIHEGSPNNTVQSRPDLEPTLPKERVKAKRHKWTEQETKDLLQGVAQFGIGSWAKILSCSDYKFDGRTAVDLKDRFRTCCPDEYRKFRSSDHAATSASCTKSMPQSTSQAGETTSKAADCEGNSGQFKRTKKVRSDSHRKTASDLAEIGINEPFKKKNRRERRGFSKEEDEALLKGYLKHGARAWNLIQKDMVLELSHRTPTDLRDRFRNRYPEKYMEAGYKVKPKASAAKNRSEAPTSIVNHSPDQMLAATKDKQPPLSRSESDTALPVQAGSNPTKAQNNTNQDSKPQEPLLKPLLPTLSGMHLPSFEVLGSDDDYSPVVLNRNIIQWAGANLPSSTPAAPPSIGHDTGLSLNATAPSGSHTIGTVATGNLASGVDGLHINPQAMIINPPSQNATTGALTLPVIWKKSGNSHGLPVLPTLTLPISHGGNLAGNSKVTYLPPPADLLSGIDMEGSREGHSSGLWDDLTLPLL